VEGRILFIPPIERFPYPNLVFTPFLIKRIDNFRPKRILFDVGIQELFGELGYTDYPQWYIDRHVYLVKELVKRFGDNLFPIIPDYPPEWKGKRLRHQVEKGLEMIKLYRKFDFANWLPVIQWEWGNLGSFKRSLLAYAPFIDEFERVAIAGGLLSRNKRTFGVALKLARREFPSKWIHALGLNLTHKRYVNPSDIDSFDTSAVKPPKGSSDYARLVGQKNEFYIARQLNKLSDAYGPLVE